MNEVRIDTHQHCLPEPYLAELERLGITTLAGYQIPTWSQPRSVEFMERYGFAGAVLSVTPGVDIAGSAHSARLARLCNEYVADVVRSDPQRFAGFAVLPMPDPERSVSEVVHALDVLGLDGVTIYSSAEGKYPGDPAFEELFDELDRRGTTVLIHPVAPSAAPSYHLPPWVLEFPFDTTRAVASLLHTGMLQRHPRVRVIVSHAGGCLPYLAHRADLRDRLPAVLADPTFDIADGLAGLYYDLTRSMAPANLAALRVTTSPSHLLLGTDWPFGGPWSELGGDPAPLLAGLDPAERRRIEFDNAAALFPRIGGAGS